jgi:hypothetical protein
MAKGSVLDIRSGIR